jgi:hypothetical protein
MTVLQSHESVILALIKRPWQAELWAEMPEACGEERELAGMPVPMHWGVGMQASHRQKCLGEFTVTVTRSLWFLLFWEAIPCRSYSSGNPLYVTLKNY